MYSIITYNDHLCFVGNQFLINVLTIEKYGTKKKIVFAVIQIYTT